MEPIDDHGDLTEKVESASAGVIIELERLVRQIQVEGAEQARRQERMKLAHNRQETDVEEHTKMSRQFAIAKDRLIEELGKRLHPILFSSAIGIADSEEEAAEISSQALEKILKRIDSFAWESPFLAWCRGFVRFGWKDRLRAILRYRKREKNIEQMAEIDAGLAQGYGGTKLLSPFQIASSREEFERMRSLLRELPGDCWKRLLWAAIGGLKLKEIASRFNETEDRAKDRHRDCRERAQEKLKARGYAR
jgi:RNA polymerase sigma factor (sigma-70 family)